MKYNFHLIPILILAPLLLFPAAYQHQLSKSAKSNISCEQNPDPLYDRTQVLKKLADILNIAAPSFRNYEKDGFEVLNEKPKRFFIYDLTDPSNTGTPLGSCVRLLNKHVYHLAGIYIPYSFSHIVFLDDGDMKVFKSVNCERGDNIRDVVELLRLRLPNDANKNQLLDRVRDYRRYGVYFTVDDTSVRCQEMKSGGR